MRKRRYEHAYYAKDQNGMELKNVGKTDCETEDDGQYTNPVCMLDRGAFSNETCTKLAHHCP